MSLCLLRTITTMIIVVVTSTMATTTTTHSAMIIVVIGNCELVESEGGSLLVGSRDTGEDTAEHDTCITSLPALRENSWSLLTWTSVSTRHSSGAHRHLIISSSVLTTECDTVFIHGDSHRQYLPLGRSCLFKLDDVLYKPSSLQQGQRLPCHHYLGGILL